MRLIWDESAWEDYLWWQTQDRKMLKRINALIRDIDRNGNEGLGKPEPLKHGLSGYWSRRITVSTVSSTRLSMTRSASRAADTTTGSEAGTPSSQGAVIPRESSKEGDRVGGRVVT